jgi:hypothetical protein
VISWRPLAVTVSVAAGSVWASACVSLAVREALQVWVVPVAVFVLAKAATGQWPLRRLLPFTLELRAKDSDSQ